MARKFKWAQAYKGKTGDPNEEWFAFYSYLNPFKPNLNASRLKKV